MKYRLDPSIDDISLESSLLKFMSVKSNYERFINVIDNKKLIPVTRTLLENYKRYYDKYNQDIDFKQFYVDFTQNWFKKHYDGNKVEEDDVAYYRNTVFPAVLNAEVNTNINIALIEREASEKIQKIMEDGFNQDAINLVLLDLAQQKQTYETVDEDVFRLTDIDLSELDNSNGIEWFLPSLQMNLGSLMPGQFVAVSADSGAGKSAFCVSQATHTIKKKYDRPILYCTSEDTKGDLNARIMSNLFSKKLVEGFEEVIKNSNYVLEMYKKHFSQDALISLQIRRPSDLIKIRNKVDKYNPCLIIIDMIDILSESLDIISITKCWNEIRAMANDGYAIIGTSQAGNTSYQDKKSGQYIHRKWLTEKDMAGSKGGGKQGAAYSLIMIGIDDEVPGVRYISTTKKKRGTSCRITARLEDKYSLYREVL